MRWGEVCYLYFSASLIPVENKKYNVIINHMTANDWAGLILTLLSIVTIVGIGTRWIVKKYVEDIVYEMKPNNGSSMKDQITRLEDKTDKIFDLMIEHLQDHSK
jgi:hypothetical protein